VFCFAFLLALMTFVVVSRRRSASWQEFFFSKKSAADGSRKGKKVKKAQPPFHVHRLNHHFRRRPNKTKNKTTKKDPIEGAIRRIFGEAPAAITISFLPVTPPP